KRAVQRGVSSFLLPLAAGQPLEVAPLVAAGKRVWGRAGLLKPGMYGTMKLVLQRFDNAVLVPASAVFSRDNKTYIYVVEGDVVRRALVQVQHEDGVQANVAFVVREGNADEGEDDALQPLTGDEQVIPIGQGELRDGQKVRVKLISW